MRRLLIIRTEKENALTTGLIEHQSAQPDHQVLVVDLGQPEPDYGKLVREIFEADSVQVY